MNTDEILARLPPCRDDEPSNLRQDIADEILDHLACGLRREILINNRNEILARERVLDRFGDPREVARKLWFQAMWSQIMSQRVVLASALFSMVICVLVIGMLGWIMQQQQQANAALLENIAKLIPAAPPSSSPLPLTNSKSHLTARVTLGSHEGEPAVGAQVIVSKALELGGQLGNNSVSQSVDDSGFVDFGLADPGRFEIRVTLKSGEFTSSTIFVPGGKEHLEQIVAPQSAPAATKIALSFSDQARKDLGSLLAEKKVGLVVRFRPQSSRVIAGRTWRVQGRALQGVPMPLVRLLPGEDFKATTEPDSDRPESDTWLSSVEDLVTYSAWNDSLEWSLPIGAYEAQFGLVNLGDSGDPRWRDLDGQGRQCGGIWLRKSNELYQAENGIDAKWEIPIPDFVRMCIINPGRIWENIAPNSLVNSGGGMGGSMGGGMGGGSGFF